MGPRQLRVSHVFLWEDFCRSVTVEQRRAPPEVEALLRECGALQSFELCMSSCWRTRPSPDPKFPEKKSIEPESLTSRVFKERAFIWIERILEAAQA